MNKSALVFAVTLVSSVALYGVPAKAADLYGGMKDDPYIAPAPPVFSWTGYYVGLQTGYEWNRAKHQLSFDDDALDIIGSGTTRPSGWIGGGYTGYNWQSQNWVFGVEGDFEGGNLSDSRTWTYPEGNTQIKSKLRWQGSLRGRVGWAANKTLLYMTAGWAFASAETSARVDFDNGPIDVLGQGTSTKTLNGWTVGGGVEHAFSNNMTLRLEYRYADYGSTSSSITDGVSIGSQSVDLDTHAIRVGAGWKF